MSSKYTWFKANVPGGLFWALIATKRLQLQGDNGPLTPYQGSALDPMHSWFSRIYNLTYIHVYRIFWTLYHNNKAIRVRRGHDTIGYSRRYIITTRQSVRRGGYDAIGYRPGCFSEIAGIPAIPKLGDFPAKDFTKYSRWPRGTFGGCQGRLPAYHRASSKEII